MTSFSRNTLAAFFSVPLLICIAQLGTAQTTNIFPTSGNAGTGTATPHRLVTIANTTTPIIGFDETGAASDVKRWAEFANGGSFYFQTINDDDTSGNTWLKINRSGNIATSILFPNGNVGFGTMSPAFDGNTTRYLSVYGGSGAFGSVGVGGSVTSTSYPVGQRPSSIQT